MKGKISLINLFIITSVILLSGKFSYSQPDSAAKTLIDSGLNANIVKSYMSCTDLQNLINRYPSISCNVDFQFCSECLGISIDISFDTSMVTTDNLSINCSQFLRQLSLCLRKIKQLETEMLESYTPPKFDMDSLSVNELKDFNVAKTGALNRIKEIIELQEIINFKLIKINEYLIYHIKKHYEK